MVVGIALLDNVTPVYFSELSGGPTGVDCVAKIVANGEMVFH